MTFRENHKHSNTGYVGSSFVIHAMSTKGQDSLARMLLNELIIEIGMWITFMKMIFVAKCKKT